MFYWYCTTIHRYQIFSTTYSVMCRVYTGYNGTSEKEHGLCTCTVDIPLAKARGLSLRTGVQTMLYFALVTVCRLKPGHVAQSVGHLTRKSGSWVRYPDWQHTFVSPSAFSRGALVSYWRKYVHEVLVNRLGGLSLPRKSVV